MTDSEREQAIRAAYAEYESDSAITQKTINVAKYVERSVEPKRSHDGQVI